MALSILLAAGWLVTLIRLQMVRRAYRRLSIQTDMSDKAEPGLREDTEEQRRVMDKICYYVIEQKGYLLPGLTLAYLSDKLGINTGSISRAVNNNTGRHFCRWLNEMRIGEAIVRLSDPARTCNFSEIAYDVGFNDRTTFFRAFKQVTGTSPRNFCRSISVVDEA